MLIIKKGIELLDACVGCLYQNPNSERESHCLLLNANCWLPIDYSLQGLAKFYKYLLFTHLKYL